MSTNSGTAVFESMVKQLTCPDLKLLDKQTIDNSIWYSVQLSIPTAEWLRKIKSKQWVEISEFSFLVHETVYTSLSLKWA